MPRNRMIKPDLWTDEALGECSTSARLLFVAGLNFADDNGNLDRSARQLKAQCFPYDDGLDCEPLILELLDAGRWLEYSVDGKFYLHIKGFAKHQKIDRPSKSDRPPPDLSTTTRRSLDEDSTTARHKRKGKERKGKKDSDATHLPISSASSPLDLKKELFHRGASFLKSCGMSDEKARTMLGSWRKHYGDLAIINALASAEGAAVSEPISYITQTLKGLPRGQKHSTVLDSVAGLMELAGTPDPSDEVF